MSALPRSIRIAVACLLTASAVALGQPAEGSARSSFGIRGGYLFAFGEWNKVPYQPTIDLFSGQFLFGGDMEIRLSDRLTLALDVGYQPLDGGDWERYTRSAGDTLDVTASFVSVAVLLRPHLFTDETNVIRMEIGPAFIFPSGQERLNGRLYTYDFFNSIKFGGQAGVEYFRMLNTWVAAGLKVGLIIAPTGVSYADGDTRTLIAMPVSAGMRFLF